MRIRFSVVAKIAGLAFAFALFDQAAQAIPLTGANGKTVDFAVIKSAGPKGLVVQVKPGSRPIELGWDKFDLALTRKAFPKIDAAYQRALGGETTVLNMGSAAAPQNPEMTVVPARNAEMEGWYEASVTGGSGGNFRSATFAISMPASGDPKGILLVSKGQDGSSIQYVSRARGGGQWSSFQEKHGFAVLTYNFKTSQGEGTGIESLKGAEFVYAEKGSGDAVFKALEQFEEKTKKKLKDLPIAIYGMDMLGAAFAFNFTQWKPERVIATVAAKGAFYGTAPTEASVRVPVLLIWGEYDQESELWGATDTHSQVFGKYVNLKPNWAYAMEMRGPPGETPQSFHFGMTFLKEMIELRMSEDGLQDLDRSKAWVGELEEFEIGKIEDPAAVLPTTKTWLPNQDLAKMWKDFVNGQLQFPTGPGA